MISLRHHRGMNARQRGFTMIEILVTVIILAIGLLGLAGLTMAPYAPWSSDRSLRPRNPAITGLARRRRAARTNQQEVR